MFWVIMKHAFLAVNHGQKFKVSDLSHHCLSPRDFLLVSLKASLLQMFLGPKLSKLLEILGQKRHWKCSFFIIINLIYTEDDTAIASIYLFNLQYLKNLNHQRNITQPALNHVHT